MSFSETKETYRRLTAAAELYSCGLDHEPGSDGRLLTDLIGVPVLNEVWSVAINAGIPDRTILDILAHKLDERSQR